MTTKRVEFSAFGPVSARPFRVAPLHHHAMLQSPHASNPQLSRCQGRHETDHHQTNPEERYTETESSPAQTNIPPSEVGVAVQKPN